MRPLPLLATLSVLCLGLAAPLSAKERVQGADLIQPGAGVEQLYPKLIPLPITDQEVTFFLERVNGVIEWAQAHKEEWGAIDKAKDTLSAIAGLEVWKQVDLSSGEFIAMVIKLKIVQELSSGNLDLNMLRQQHAFMKGMLNNPDLPPESKKELEKNVAVLGKMIEGFDKYPDDNKAVYEKHKDKIDAALRKIEALDAKKNKQAPNAKNEPQQPAKPDSATPDAPQPQSGQQN